MSEFATIMQEKYYAHSHEYYHRLWSLEEIMGLSRNYVKYATQYDELLRRYGARTELSREALKRIAKKENRDIIEDGNLLHLGNCIQAEQKMQSSPYPPLVLTVEEMAKLLGIGRTKAYELAQRPGFPAVRVGKKILVNSNELTKWLAKGCGKENGGDE